MATIDINSINSELQNILSRVDFKPTNRAAAILKDKLVSVTSSKLGIDIDTTVNGFKSLTQQVDQPGADTATGGIVMLDDNPSGISIRNNTPSGSSDLQAITGASIGGGFLQSAITASTPRALYTTLRAVSSASPPAIVRSVQQLVPAAYQQQLVAALNEIETGKQLTDQLTQQVAQYGGALTDAISNGAGAILNNVIEGLTGTYASALRQIVGDRPLTEQQTRDVIAAIERGDIVGAARLLEGLTDLSTQQVEAILSNVPTNLVDLVEDAFDQELPDQIIKNIGETQ